MKLETVLTKILVEAGETKAEAARQAKAAAAAVGIEKVTQHQADSLMQQARAQIG